MFVVKAAGLKVEAGGRILFEDGDIQVRPGEKVALIGANGVGKTTLLKVLAGVITPDGGTVNRSVSVDRWGILNQQETFPSSITAGDYVRSGHPRLFRLYRELRQAERSLEQDAGEKLEARIARYGACQEAYQNAGGYEWEVEVLRTMKHLGLTPGVSDTSMEQLSGGQKTRAQLAQLMVKRPEFLLLDEPTNHLDRSTLEWLETWLSGWNGAALFVSHDRWFIDRVADVTVELSKTGTRAIRGGYSRFTEHRDQERKAQEALWRKQEQEKKKLEESIRRYQTWFHRAHAAAGERNPFLKKKAQKNQTRSKAKEEALRRLEENRVERPRENPRVQVRLNAAPIEGRHLLTVTDLAFGYGEKALLDGIDFDIRPGDRLALTGANGSGKTTLLKLLTGELHSQRGEVRRHPELRIGYFAQELEILDPQETILDSLLRLPGMTRTEARNILASFLFRADSVFQRIGSLSMGERCRVAFVRLYFSRANLLILDEPTNYLDIPTRERIEEALAHYPGSMVLVSHDRFLLSLIANRVASLENGRLALFEEGYHAYLERKRQATARSHTDPDRIRMLELRLTQLMGAEEPEDEGVRQQLMAEIRKIRSELDQWKGRGKEE
ncbi:ribosomal protection-like ABC-F family protein [Desmospora profundinema]|uniref:ATPase subunit of ABC transporter with duplicated ATPase domains n=1 Tax=Desmospora profundinema TaxID=1571184 RepID=A0ABU1IQK5_9BACL|nr:ABC-F type ribosomal protection protein [Desmospora profundinema]MDR6226698.1 ATPase subunit of ABC transporter with duplicated ATPase domains [Desmospora profundinema]